jgi:hypothetical protein
VPDDEEQSQAEEALGESGGLNDPVLAWAKNNLAWSVAALGLALLLLKLLFVARGDISTALALIELASPKSVLLGTLVSNMSVVATGLFIASGAWLGMAVARQRSPELVAVFAVPLLIISVMITPLPGFGSVSQDVLSGALIAFGAGYVITQIAPLIIRWAYDSPEFAILTDGLRAYAPLGSLLALRQSGERWLNAYGLSVSTKETGSADKLLDDLPSSVRAPIASYLHGGLRGLR